MTSGSSGEGADDALKVSQGRTETKKGNEIKKGRFSISTQPVSPTKSNVPSALGAGNSELDFAVAAAAAATAPAALLRDPVMMAGQGFTTPGASSRDSAEYVPLPGSVNDKPFYNNIDKTWKGRGAKKGTVEPTVLPAAASTTLAGAQGSEAGPAAAQELIAAAAAPGTTATAQPAPAADGVKKQQGRFQVQQVAPSPQAKLPQTASDRDTEALQQPILAQASGAKTPTPSPSKPASYALAAASPAAIASEVIYQGHGPLAGIPMPVQRGRFQVAQIAASPQIPSNCDHKTNSAASRKSSLPSIKANIAPTPTPNGAKVGFKLGNHTSETSDPAGLVAPTQAKPQETHKTGRFKVKKDVDNDVRSTPYECIVKGKDREAFDKIELITFKVHDSFILHDPAAANIAKVAPVKPPANTSAGPPNVAAAVGEEATVVPTATAKPAAAPTAAPAGNLAASKVLPQTVGAGAVAAPAQVDAHIGAPQGAASLSAMVRKELIEMLDPDEMKKRQMILIKSSRDLIKSFEKTENDVARKTQEQNRKIIEGQKELEKLFNVHIQKTQQQIEKLVEDNKHLMEENKRERQARQKADEENKTMLERILMKLGGSVGSRDHP